MTISAQFPAADFDFFQRLVADRTSIVLNPEQHYLIDTRLHPIAKSQGFATSCELVTHLRTNRDERLCSRAAEAMTTNETSFFRDLHPFEALRTQLLPPIIAARQRQQALNIWCAACSSGQEPYTIAMLLKENFPQLDSWRVRILATDLSGRMLERASQGLYSQLEVNRGLPARLLVKYFQRVGTDWQIDPKLRALVDCRELNLAKPWPAIGQIDVLFLRNVLIYFSNDTKTQILSRCARLLANDGFLFLGGAETTLNLCDEFERVPLDKTGCYRLRPKT